MNSVEQDEIGSGATVVVGIAELVTCEEAFVGGRGGDSLGIVRDAAVVVEGGRIAWIGPASRAPAAENRIDLGAGPSSRDSSTHTPIWSSPAIARRSSRPE